jgi:uncharacterized protein (TIGR03083 family)
MAVIAVDPAQTEQALLDVTAQLAALLRPLPSTGIRLPGYDWTVGDAAAHLLVTGRHFAELAAGSPALYAQGTREALAATNAERLLEVDERDGGALADQLEEAARTFVATVATRPPLQRSRTPMGEMDLATVCSYALTHTLLHSIPIARALGRPWRFPKEYVLLTLPFLTTALYQVVVAERVQGLTASFLVHLRGGGPRLAIAFDDGVLSVAGAPVARVDCHISADPVTFFLVGLGLQGQWGAIARGKMIAWGTKPWLAFRFTSYFSSP